MITKEARYYNSKGHLIATCDLQLNEMSECFGRIISSGSRCEVNRTALVKGNNVTFTHVEKEQFLNNTFAAKSHEEAVVMALRHVDLAKKFISPKAFAEAKLKIINT
jgi:hypothetical protein